ncbi:MAG: DJ-1/PfpI family protein [Planctomycetota bacterium]
MTKRVLVPLAPGFEEIEAVTIIDVLRRGGADVTVAGTQGAMVEGSHGIVLTADALLSDVREDSFDLVVLPGGMPGAANLRDDVAVLAMLRTTAAAGRWVAAICAAPIALSAAGLLSERSATSYPTFEDQVAAREYREDRVVVDGNVVTSRGPGTALEFSLELVRLLIGEPECEKLTEAMLVKR